MLELVLPSLVELDHHVTDVLGKTLILDVVHHRSMNLIGHNSEWLRRRGRRDLLQKVVTEGVLNPGVLQEDSLGSHVEDTVVSLDYTEETKLDKSHKKSSGYNEVLTNILRIDHGSLSVVLVDHILL